MSRTHDIERGLRSLDAAGRRADRDTTRARTDLERILATDPTERPPERPSRPSPSHDTWRAKPRRAARNVALVGAALMTVTAGVVALPAASGGDPAFATWTPDPDAVPALGRPEAAADCREALQDGAGSDQPLSAAEPVIAERRGVWTTVVLAGPEGLSAMCVTDESRPFWGRGMIGHLAPARAGHTAPGPRELEAAALGDGIIDNEPLSLAAGAAGEDIAAVAYLSPAHGEVTASVAGGHFALWLPGDELRGASSAGVELRVTYRDGTTGTTRLSF